MTGADIGKRDQYGDEAERMYVEQNLSCREIARRLGGGGVVTGKTVAEWCNWGNWTEARRRRRAQGNAVDELRAEAEKELAKLRGREGEYSTMDPSKRIDIMAKLKSILKQDTKTLDPRRVMEIAIGVLFALARYLGKAAPDLADALSRHMHPFLKLVRAGKVEITILPSEEESDD